MIKRELLKIAKEKVVQDSNLENQKRRGILQPSKMLFFLFVFNLLNFTTLFYVS